MIWIIGVLCLWLRLAWRVGWLLLGLLFALLFCADYDLFDYYSLFTVLWLGWWDSWLVGGFVWLLVVSIIVLLGFVLLLCSVSWLWLLGLECLLCCYFILVLGWGACGFVMFELWLFADCLGLFCVFAFLFCLRLVVRVVCYWFVLYIWLCFSFVG